MGVYGHHLITWLIIGLIAGALAGRVVSGGGFGILTDTVVGLAGALIGGALLHALGPDRGVIAGNGLIDDIVVAFVGAVILLGLLRLIAGGRVRTARRERDRWR